jgi:HAD superfamily hydrolase (TIGR01509 family)
VTQAAAPQAVVFDLDGLMFNTESLYRRVGTELLARRNRVADEAMFTAMMGRPPKVALQVMINWHALDATVEELLAETAVIFQPILDQHLAPMPGLVDLLEFLEARHVPRAIATSSPRGFVEYVLSRFALEPRFEFALTSEDVTEGKPHPEIYRRACERLGRRPGEVIVFEDSEAGCRSAVASGARVVAVPGEYSTSHDFRGAELIAEGLGDLRIRQLFF